MVEGINQHPPRTPMELLHSNIWWYVGLNSLAMVSPNTRAHELYCKGLQCVDAIWISEDQNLLACVKATSLETTSYIGHMIGIGFVWARKEPSCGPFGTKVVVVNKWRAYILPFPISHQCIFCLLNTSELVNHKLWEFIQARRVWQCATSNMHKPCGWGWAIMIPFIGSMPFLTKEFPRSLYNSFEKQLASSLWYYSLKIMNWMQPQSC